MSRLGDVIGLYLLWIRNHHMAIHKDVWDAFGYTRQHWCTYE